jgi:hypothetical protein
MKKPSPGGATIKTFQFPNKPSNDAVFFKEILVTPPAYLAHLAPLILPAQHRFKRQPDRFGIGGVK